MAIIKMFSFETGTTPLSLGLIFHSGSPHSITSAAARTQSRSLMLVNYGAFGISGKAYYPLPQAVSTVWVQLAYYSDSYPDKPVGQSPASGDRFGMIDFWSDTTHCIQIGFEPAAYKIVAAMHDTSTIASSTSSNLFTLGVWHFIEAKLVISDTAGSILVKLNGVTVLDATGIDTKYSTLNTVNRVMFGTNHGPVLATALMDDIIIGDGTGLNASPPGDARVEYLAPIAAGNRTQFTPSAGSNWGNVDEFGTPSDSDYNWSSEVGSTDLFSMSNLTGNGVVHAVQTVIRSRKDDVGFRLVKPAFYKPIGQGDTTRLYTNAAPATSVLDSFSYSTSVLETSPDTASAWTVEEIADLQFGYVVGGGSQFSADAWLAAF